MKFEIKDLKKLLSSIKQNHINLINIESRKFKLTINKTYNTDTKIIQPASINKTHITHPEFLHASKEKINNKQKVAQLKNNETEIYSTIVSPMVGTFYRSPGPNESPFIEPYEIVQKKQTVCIIEAMKLMNEIEAEVNGEIVEILVNDGDIVDCGQALMKIKPI